MMRLKSTFFKTKFQNKLGNKLMGKKYGLSAIMVLRCPMTINGRTICLFDNI